MKKTLNLLLLLSAFLACAGNSSAALIAAWDGQNTPGSAVNPQPPPWDYDDNVTVSPLTMHGSVIGAGSGNPFTFMGFSDIIDQTNYVGFSIKPDQGYQLNLVDFFISQPAFSGTGYSLGYRIAGGAWNMFAESLTYSGQTELRTFTFSGPVITTEEVEFGFFASATSPTSGVAMASRGSALRNEIQVNGSVDAIPEPSAAMLAGLGLVAAGFRRRAQRI